MFDKVYQIVKTIPRGKVMTYGQIAKLIGTRDTRKIGWALHANKSNDVPCHRVVNKDGRLAPNYAFGGADEQKLRLLSEGIKIKNTIYVDLKKYLHV